MPIQPRRAGTIAASVFLLVLVGCILNGYSFGLIDYDYYWHLASGRWIWENGALPRTDPFSWTFEGQPWTAHEWLFQVIAHGLYSAAGHPGMQIGAMLTVTAALALSVTTADRLADRPLALTFAAILFAGGLVGFATPRPHVISYLLFAIFLAVLFRARYHGRLRGLVWLPPLMVFWVNVHGGYAIGIALVVAFAGGEALNALLTRRESARRLALWLAGTAVAVFLASAVNPWGPAHWLYPLEVMGLDAVRIIGEWKPVLNSPLYGPWYVAGVVLFALLTVLRRSRPDVTEITLPLALIIAGFLQIRHTPFAGLVMTAYAGVAMADGALDRFGPLFRRRGPPPRTLTVAAGLVALMTLAAFAASDYFRAVQRFLPEDVAVWIETNRPEGRIYNDYGAGGYLMQRLPGLKVFIDGRADLYGDAFVFEHFAFVFAQPGWEEVPARWDIGYAVLRHDHVVTPKLLAAGWTEAFHGDTFNVLLPPGR